MHDKAHSLANKHHRLASRAGNAGNPALADRHREVAKRLRRRGKSYGAKQKQLSGKRNIEDSVAQMESRDPAYMSQYRSRSSAMERFRVLAGLEEQVAMPRDAGVFGTTRHNADYAQMVEGKDEKSGHWYDTGRLPTPDDSLGRLAFASMQKMKKSAKKKKQDEEE